MSNELNKEDLYKLERLTLHGKSMMSSFIQNSYIGNIDVPAIISIAARNNEYIGWALLQFYNKGDRYVKSIDVFVDPKYRSTGIGSALINMVKTQGSLINQINSIPVEKEPRVGAWDELSRKFYKKHKLEGDIESLPTSEVKIKAPPSEELEDMFGDLDKELQQTAKIKYLISKYS